MFTAKAICFGIALIVVAWFAIAFIGTYLGYFKNEDEWPYE